MDAQPRSGLAAGPGPRGRGERGSAVVTLALALAVTVVALAIVVVTARTVRDRALAQRAADAAALAAVVDGEAGAARLAAANGASLVTVERLGDDVRVTVRVGRVTARAQAADAGCRGSCPAIP